MDLKSFVLEHVLQAVIEETKEPDKDCILYSVQIGKKIMYLNEDDFQILQNTFKSIKSERK